MLKPCCGKGHLFTEANTLWKSRPGLNYKIRECRTCRREGERRRKDFLLRPRWSAEEVSVLKEMVENGANSFRIARKLGRAASSVRCKRRELHLKAPPKAPVMATPKPVPKDPVFVTISIVEIASFYELGGWRLVDRDGDRCKFEWQSEKDPQWPERKRMAA